MGVMRALLVVLLACTTLTGATQATEIRFDSRYVLNTTEVTDLRPLGYGEKLCTDTAGVECWIEYHND